MGVVKTPTFQLETRLLAMAQYLVTTKEEVGGSIPGPCGEVMDLPIVILEPYRNHVYISQLKLLLLLL